MVPLEIAGVRVDLALAGPAPAALERFRRFAGAAGAAGWHLRLEPGRALPAQPPGRCVVEAAGRWVVPGLEEAGWLDPATGQGSAQADPDLMVLDTLVRAAVAASVLQRGGLLFHGVTVVVDGGAYLCPARSGSGKSTLASLAGHPLADEVSALLPEAGGFTAHATPWWRSRGGAAPLAAVCALSWEGEGFGPLPESPLRQLAANLVLPLDSAAGRARALEVAAAIARTAPLARLAFQRTSDVDRLLRHPSGPLRTVGGRQGPW
jgi:hypothetical protein